MTAAAALVVLAGGGASPAVAATSTTSSAPATSAPVTTTRTTSSTLRTSTTTTAMSMPRTTTTTPWVVTRDFEDGVKRAESLGAALSVVEDDTHVLRADVFDNIAGDVRISAWDEELAGPSWFSGSVRLKLAAGSAPTYFQVFAGDVPAGPAQQITDQGWSYLTFATAYNGSTTAGLPGTSAERVGFTWTIRTVNACQPTTAVPEQDFLLDDFRLIKFDNDLLTWPVSDYSLDCPAVPAVAPPFADGEPGPFSVIRSWNFEDDSLAPFSSSGGLHLGTSDEFPSEGSRGLVVTWNRLDTGDHQVEEPSEDLVVGRYYSVVASARLTPGTAPRHWGYSSRTSAWQQQFSGVNPPTWINFEFQYQGNDRAIIHLAKFRRNVSWCGMVENAPDRVYLDQVELRVSANQQPVNYPTPSCPVLTTTTSTTTSTTTTEHTTTTTTTRGSSTTTTRMVDPTVTTPVSTSTTMAPTTTRPPTTTLRTTPGQWDMSTSTTTSAATAGCSATYRLVSTWPGYAQAAVTVKAVKPITSWTASWSLPPGAVVERSWSGEVTQTAQRVTAKSYSWNGKLAAGASTEFGLIIKGGGTAIPALSCTGG